MTRKKVSIIVPVYKSEKFLIKLIESILNQTYSNFELILVDDGSPDNSGIICDEYAKKDARIIVIHKENGGTCEARNVGLTNVTGEYIMFADGDDWFALDCIEYLVDLLEKNNADMSLSDSVFVTPNLKQNKNDKIRILNSEEATCVILYVKTPVGPWNKLYKTSIIKNNKLTFSVPWFGEGLFFSVMAAQYSKKIAIGHRKIYVYRKNNPNSGTTVRNVQHGINSLNNIIYIKNNLVINTPKTIAASNWHIWKNYFNLIMYIVDAKAKNEYKIEFKNAKSQLQKNLFKVFIKSKVSFKKKIEIVVLSLFPVLSAKLILKIKRKRFENDRT